MIQIHMFVQIFMNSPTPMEDASTTVLIQLEATIVLVLIQLGILSVKMATIALIFKYSKI